jgi:hypothetical protein
MCCGDRLRPPKKRGFPNALSAFKAKIDWAEPLDGKFIPYDQAQFEHARRNLDFLASDFNLTLEQRRKVAEKIIQAQRQLSPKELMLAQAYYDVSMVERSVRYWTGRGLTMTQAYVEIAAANDMKPESLTRYLRNAKKRLREAK